MKAEKGHILYRIDRMIGLVIKVDAVILFVLLILACFHFSNRYVWYIFGGIIAACIVCRMVLEFFVKSEDEEEFEQQVDYIVQQKQALMTAEQKEYSPLRNVSPEQEIQIMQLLRELPAHSEKPGYINLAFIAQYLTALDKMGKANLRDRHNLRIWVENITGKKAPDSSHFNEAIPSTATTKVAAARKELEKIL